MASWEASVGATDEWYTPPEVFEALGCMFDMDVAAPMLLPAYIGDRLRPYTASGGRRWLWKASLESEWTGFLWMNPPFGARNALGPWLTKFFNHGDGIALTPDRTSAPWFQDAWRRADAVLFVCDKIKFIRPDGSRGKQPGTGTALWAAGDAGVAALERAARGGFGILGKPISPTPEAGGV